MAAGGSLSAAGAGVQMFAVLQQAQTQSAISRFNARVARRNAEQDALLLERDASIADLDAEQERTARDFDVKTRRKIFSRIRARRRSQIGASGLEFSGSPLVVAADEAREMELDIAALEFVSEAREAALRDDAGLLRFHAEERRRGGRFAGSIGRLERRIIQRGLPVRLAGAATGAAGGTIQGLETARLNRSLTTRELETRRAA